MVFISVKQKVFTKYYFKYLQQNKTYVTGILLDLKRAV